MSFFAWVGFAVYGLTYGDSAWYIYPYNLESAVNKTKSQMKELSTNAGSLLFANVCLIGMALLPLLRLEPAATVIISRAQKLPLACAKQPVTVCRAVCMDLEIGS